MPPERADLLFRDSMGETGVPLSRRWLMWSAVALNTQWKRGGLRRARVFLWLVIFGLAALVVWPTVAVVVALSFGWSAIAFAALAVAAAVVLPVACSLLWGRSWRLGALGGLALVFFTVPVVLVLVALGAYFAVEWLVERVCVRKALRNPVLTRHL